MPLRRPAKLTVSGFSPFQPLCSSNLSGPSSPTNPRTPLTPPPRLHLRPLIPGPPLSPEFLSTAPPTPYPWVWRCHLCQSVYRIGVTRRCLEDGHFFCSLPTPPSSPVDDNSDNEDGTQSMDGEMKRKECHRRGKIKRERKKRRQPRQVRGCRSEFDYSGWSRYHIWRREVATLRAKHRRVERETASLAGEEKNCWINCDFPSECHNSRLELIRSQSAATAESVRSELEDAPDTSLSRTPHSLVSSVSADEDDANSMVETEESDMGWDTELLSVDIGVDGCKLFDRKEECSEGRSSPLKMFFLSTGEERENGRDADNDSDS
ncbi:hypothetical protein M430DRAFT_252801 [Amorphotheca resinae ATCC 22711]|uniref:Uncharacterized protein n=1 Tax=Amorphotheca resinae ATCC 22711 TaxID=857342 RepID=A0A2T3AXI6_AMORE|nr:hypothetical protein M430DRAFT_252801 [Amorphotheca resinae ATCC 22711]PSS14787.1 hypothetical protein M430DRAFT_252801 [Amorphotheca resinae ATCC 22711]